MAYWILDTSIERSGGGCDRPCLCSNCAALFSPPRAARRHRRAWGRRPAVPLDRCAAARPRSDGQSRRGRALRTRFRWCDAAGHAERDPRNGTRGRPAGDPAGPAFEFAKSLSFAAKSLLV
ncbi:hypothetical protein AD428_02765 [Achromobacter sp. DMS1]|nr:hypothetical protein AD428_02765 [Achromobacter sp. DMS1]